MKLCKEKFNKNTPKEKCGGCNEIKHVYLKSKIKSKHLEETPLCSKMCVRKVFGFTPMVKS